MLQLRCLVSFLVCFGFYPACTSIHFKVIAPFSIRDSAYLALIPKVRDNTTTFDLVITTFSSTPFTTDRVQYVPDVGRHLYAPVRWKAQLITDRLPCPNEVNIVPDDVFQRPGILSVASGFFTLSKNHGSVDLLEGWQDQKVPPVSISSHGPEEEWFYHRVEWVDMNGDGRKDALTARAYFNSVFGLRVSSKSQLVWFEQPSFNGSLTPSWTGHVIADCADLFFRSTILTIGGKNKTAIFSAGYFNKKLTVTWTEDPNDNWTDGTKIKTRTIDDELGMYYSVEVADMNSDGRRDLLVTVSSTDNGTVLVYEIPDDVINGTWERHFIAVNFSVPGLFKQGKGTPGLASPFYISTTNSTGKPYVMVNGYDDGRAYVLSPLSQDPADWNYQKRAFHAGLFAVIGNGYQILDVNGDGIKELFLPLYSQGQVRIFQVLPD